MKEAANSSAEIYERVGGDGSFVAACSTLASLRAAIAEEEAALAAQLSKRELLVASGVLCAPSQTTTGDGVNVDRSSESGGVLLQQGRNPTQDDVDFEEAALRRLWDASVNAVLQKCARNTELAVHEASSQAVEGDFPHAASGGFLWALPPSSAEVNEASAKLSRDEYFRLSKPGSEQLLLFDADVGGASSPMGRNKKQSLTDAAKTVRSLATVGGVASNSSSSSVAKGLLRPLRSNMKPVGFRGTGQTGTEDEEDSDDGDSSDGYDEDFQREWREQTSTIYAVCRKVESAVCAFSDSQLLDPLDGSDDPLDVDRVVHPSEKTLSHASVQAMERINNATSEFGNMILALHQSRMVQVLKALSLASSPSSLEDGSTSISLPLLPCEEEILWSTVRVAFRHCDVAARKRWLTSTSRIATDLNFARSPDIANVCFLISALGALDSEKLWADDLAEASQALRGRFVAKGVAAAFGADTPTQNLSTVLEFKPILSQRHRYRRLATMLSRLGGKGFSRRVRALQRMGVVEPTWGDLGISCMGIGGATSSHNFESDTVVGGSRGVLERAVANQKRSAPTMALMDATRISEEIVTSNM